MSRRPRWWRITGSSQRGSFATALHIEGGWRRACRTAALALLLLAPSTAAMPAEDADRYDVQRVRLGLAGQWQVLQGAEDREVWKELAGLDGGEWTAVELPGRLLPPGPTGQAQQKVRSVWAVRVFDVPDELARRDAVLKTDGLRFGATIWLNGRELARHALISPHAILIPPGLLRAGRNVLVLKVSGWAGVARSASGYPLMPTGSATQSWGAKDAMVLATWLEFYQGAYMKWIHAVPDVSGGAVTFRVWLDGRRPLPARVSLRATVSLADGSTGQAASAPGAKASSADDGAAVAGAARARLEVPTDGRPVELRVPLRPAVAWAPERPALYTARLEADVDGQACDRAALRFGLRSIEVVDGHYRLNGRALWLRGSNLVYEWMWGDGREPSSRFEPWDYLIDQARQMNLNCFRTHSLPPPTDWSSACDRGGRMLLAELPILYNNRDFKFTVEELEVFHANALADAAGWVTRLWNHPSIIVWVLSNESRADGAWERGPLRDHVRGLDSTRPCLRADGLTGESRDQHTCNNIDGTPEGWLHEFVLRLAGERDPRRTLSNTEYMNVFRPDEALSLLWTGTKRTTHHPRWFAEMLLEHTETMRRAQFDMILPYMYAGWTRRGRPDWRAGFPTPASAALHSAMSPVLASLDLFDMHYVAGQAVVTPVAMINETPRAAKVRVEFVLTPVDPLCLPDEQALASAVWKDSRELTLPGEAITRQELSWPVPDKEGVYFLAAVLHREGARPVVSQRRVCAVAEEPIPAAADRLGEAPSSPGGGPSAARLRVLALGADEALLTLLRRQGIVCATALTGERVEADVAVIGDAGRLEQSRREALARPLREFVADGGRLVILAGERWDWPALIPLSMEQYDASRAFVADSPAARALLGDLPAPLLWRWNGLPGRVVQAVFRGELPPGSQRLLRAGGAARVASAAIPHGAGVIIVCLLDFDRRLNPGQGAFDPAAGKLLLRMLLQPGARHNGGAGPPTRAAPPSG